MKKKSIIRILFLLVAAVAGCTEDSIQMNAARLPDEAILGSISSTLRSNSSFSGKAIIKLTNDTEEQIVVDEIYYKLNRPVADEVKVTVSLETEMSREFEEEIKADNAKIEAANENLFESWRKPLLSAAVFPAKNVIAGEGTLTVSAGKEVSSSIKLMLSTKDLPADIDVYELLFSVKRTDADGQTENQYLRYRVNVRQKAGEMTSVGGEEIKLDTRFLTVYYLNTSTYQPILADIFMYTRTNNTTYQTEEAHSLGNIVNLRIVTVGYDNNSGRARLTLSNDMRYVLENADKYIRPLQDHGRKVCLCIEGGGKGLGFCNMSEGQITDFTQQVKDVVDLYQLDGVNLRDEGSGYGKEGMPAINTTSYPKLIKSLREAMPGKLLTLVDKDEPTATFYDPALCDGIEVGKYIDYAWHGYDNEVEIIQIINPWESGHAYSEYTRKPIAGLTAERYGSVNIPLYPKHDPMFFTNFDKRIYDWKQAGNHCNGIIVFGNDMISDEQNEHEYGMKMRCLNYIGSIADDGRDEWEENTYPPGTGFLTGGDYSYSIDVLKEYDGFNVGYRYLAKDW